MFLSKYTQETFSKILHKKNECVFENEIKEIKRQKKLCNEKFNIFYDGLVNIIEKILEKNNTEKFVTCTIDLSFADICIIQKHVEYENVIDVLAGREL